MKINEIGVGTKVSMSFIINGKDIRLFGEVVSKTMQKELFGVLSDFEAAMVPACVVLINEPQILKGEKECVADTLLAPKDCVTYLWECVDGRLFEAEGQYYLYMASPKYGLQFNRRGNLRICVNTKSEIYFQDDATHEILIKDVSENGIGFYISNDVQLDIGEHCIIALEKLERSNENIPQRFKDCAEIEVEVVRIAESKNDMILYGCVIVS